MSYSNYSTYLKFKNCCRPIGDTGPPGPTGPEGPTITGNRGDIIYFSETDNLVSTNNIFIQEGNVTVNNNLIVTGITYLNNTLEVTGNAIINGNLSIY
jgi:signal peptidase I